MNENAAFIRAILNAPEDDLPRLVYADWLEERGDLRGEYLRAEYEWGKLRSPVDPYHPLPKALSELGRQIDLSWLRSTSRIAREVPKLWGALPGDYASLIPEVSAEELSTRWTEALRKIQETFASYIGHEETAKRFCVPVDYAIFMVAIGGQRIGWLDDTFRIHDAGRVADRTNSDCDCREWSRVDRVEDEGLWLTFGDGWGDHEKRLICCDLEHPLFGVVAETKDDGHPWFNGFRAMGGLSPTFLGFLKDSLFYETAKFHETTERGRPIPNFSVSRWFDCTKSGASDEAWSSEGAVVYWKPNEYIGHLGLPSSSYSELRPNQPNVLRPIFRDFFEHALASFGLDVSKYVSFHPAGFVECNLSTAPYKLWARMYRFAEMFANSQKCVILDDSFFVAYEGVQE